MARNYKELFGVDYPSVTTILNFYPKGQGFYNWLMIKGKDESERIKTEAGKTGHYIHTAIENILKGEELDSTYLTKKEEQLLNVFIDWWTKLKKEHKVKILDIEKPVINRIHKYVGTIDLVISIDKQLWIIDIKTSNYISNTFALQLSAYKHALLEEQPKGLRPGYGFINTTNYKLGIFHLKSNEFREVEDEFETFLAVKRIFDYENSRVKL